MAHSHNRNNCLLENSFCRRAQCFGMCLPKGIFIISDSCWSWCPVSVYQKGEQQHSASEQDPALLCSEACRSRQLSGERKLLLASSQACNVCKTLVAWWSPGLPSALRIGNLTVLQAAFLWAVPRSIVWHWQSQLFQRNAPGSSCFLSQPSWLRTSPAASPPCSIVPAVHASRLGVLCQTRTTLQRSSWELWSRATAGGSTTQPSFSLCHLCDFPLKSLCHLKEFRLLSFWVTVRPVGATNSAKWTVK